MEFSVVDSIDDDDHSERTNLSSDLKSSAGHLQSLQKRESAATTAISGTSQIMGDDAKTAISTAGCDKQTNTGGPPAAANLSVLQQQQQNEHAGSISNLLTTSVSASSQASATVTTTSLSRHNDAVLGNNQQPSCDAPVSANRNASTISSASPIAGGASNATGQGNNAPNVGGQNFAVVDEEILEDFDAEEFVVQDEAMEESNETGGDAVGSGRSELRNNNIAATGDISSIHSQSSGGGLVATGTNFGTASSARSSPPASHDYVQDFLQAFGPVGDGVRSLMPAGDALNAELASGMSYQTALGQYTRAVKDAATDLPCAICGEHVLSLRAWFVHHFKPRHRALTKLIGHFRSKCIENQDEDAESFLQASLTDLQGQLKFSQELFELKDEAGCYSAFCGVCCMDVTSNISEHVKSRSHNVAYMNLLHPEELAEIKLQAFKTAGRLSISEYAKNIEKFLAKTLPKVGGSALEMVVLKGSGGLPLWIQRYMKTLQDMKLRAEGITEEMSRPSSIDASLPPNEYEFYKDGICLICHSKCDGNNPDDLAKHAATTEHQKKLSVRDFMENTAHYSVIDGLVSVMQQSVEEKSKTVPLIGVECICDFHLQIDEKTPAVQFWLCWLCNVGAKNAKCVDHLVSHGHSFNYIAEHFPDVKPANNDDKKRLKTLCAEIMEDRGIEKIRVALVHAESKDEASKIVKSFQSQSKSAVSAEASNKPSEEAGTAKSSDDNKAKLAKKQTTAEGSTSALVKGKPVSPKKDKSALPKVSSTKAAGNSKPGGSSGASKACDKNRDRVTSNKEALPDSALESNLLNAPATASSGREPRGYGRRNKPWISDETLKLILERKAIRDSLTPTQLREMNNDIRRLLRAERKKYDEAQLPAADASAGHSRKAAQLPKAASSGFTLVTPDPSDFDQSAVDEGAWMNDELRFMMASRRKAHQLWVKTRSEEQRRLYRATRNNILKVIRANKKICAPLQKRLDEAGSFEEIVDVLLQSNTLTLRDENAYVQRLLDASTNALIGVNQLYEIRCDDDHFEPAYLCKGCSSVIKAAELLAHITEPGHILQYLNSYYKEDYDSYVAKYANLPDQYVKLTQYAAGVELREGRQPVTQRLSFKLSPRLLTSPKETGIYYKPKDERKRRRSGESSARRSRQSPERRPARRSRSRESVRRRESTASSARVSERDRRSTAHGPDRTRSRSRSPPRRVVERSPSRSSRRSPAPSSRSHRGESRRSSRERDVRSAKDGRSGGRPSDSRGHSDRKSSSRRSKNAPEPRREIDHWHRESESGSRHLREPQPPGVMERPRDDAALMNSLLMEKLQSARRQGQSSSAELDALLASMGGGAHFSNAPANIQSEIMMLMNAPQSSSHGYPQPYGAGGGKDERMMQLLLEMAQRQKQQEAALNEEQAKRRQLESQLKSVKAVTAYSYGLDPTKPQHHEHKPKQPPPPQVASSDGYWSVGSNRSTGGGSSLTTALPPQFADYSGGMGQPPSGAVDKQGKVLEHLQKRRLELSLPGMPNLSAPPPSVSAIDPYGQLGRVAGLHSTAMPPPNINEAMLRQIGGATPSQQHSFAAALAGLRQPSNQYFGIVPLQQQPPPGGSGR